MYIQVLDREKDEVFLRVSSEKIIRLYLGGPTDRFYIFSSVYSAAFAEHTGQAWIQNIMAHCWFKYGTLHRTDGFAEVGYDSSGKIIRKVFRLNGGIVSMDEIFNQMSDEQKEKVIWNLDEWK